MVWINNDILLLIAEHVNLVDQRGYFRLLRVCRRWHAILFPRAYRRISVSENQIYRLVRSIYRNPSIGAEIRDLYVWWALGGSETEYYNGVMPEAEYDVSIVKDVVERICDSPQERAR